MGTRRKLVDVALGRAPADVLVSGGTVVGVATGEMYAADVAISAGRIAAVGEVDYAIGSETERIDACGCYVVPGLIDAHIHSYHSYLRLDAYAALLLKSGVTATVDGFYGQGIVGGIEAVRASVAAFETLPIRLVFLVPTMAYLQNRDLGLTPAPGISIQEMRTMLGWDACRGLEEPPFLPVAEHDDDLLDLFEETLAMHKVVTGHAAGLDWREVQAYAAAGVSTDHEMVSADEAVARARAGMKLLARQGSGAEDVPKVIGALTDHGIDPHTMTFCCDIASPEKLAHEGGVDQAVRLAIKAGIPPARAIQMATLNAAEVFGVQHEIGLIAPGRLADIVLVGDLEHFSVDCVLVEGSIVVETGKVTAEMTPPSYPQPFYKSVKVARAFTPQDLAVRPHAPARRAEVRVIGVTDGVLESDERHLWVDVADGIVMPDPAQDVLSLVMVDRLEKGTGIGFGFIQGFGLHKGAIASSVNAVCENLVAVGADLGDMAKAMNAVLDSDGGIAVAADGAVLALVELPVLGLLSDDSLPIALAKFAAVSAAIRKLGCSLTNPLSQLEFCCACGEIGQLKISEEGLFSHVEQKLVEPLLALRT